MNYYEKLKSCLREQDLKRDDVIRELSFIDRHNHSRKYFDYQNRAKSLGRRLNNKCNSIVGFLMGFANKPTGELVTSYYASPPD